MVAPVIFAAPALFWTVTLTDAPPTGCACTCVPLLEYGHPSLTSVPRATWTASPVFPLNVVPVAEKVGVPVPEAPTWTPVAFRVTAPPVKVSFPTTSEAPTVGESTVVAPLTVDDTAELSMVSAADSTRIPVAAPSTATADIVTGQWPVTCTPVESRGTGVPDDAADTFTVEMAIGARSAATGHAVRMPSPVDVPFWISNPVIDPPGPMVMRGEVSAVDEVTA